MNSNTAAQLLSPRRNAKPSRRLFRCHVRVLKIPCQIIPIIWANSTVCAPSEHRLLVETGMTCKYAHTNSSNKTTPRSVTFPPTTSTLLSIQLLFRKQRASTSPGHASAPFPE